MTENISQPNVILVSHSTEYNDTLLNDFDDDMDEYYEEEIEICQNPPIPLRSSYSTHTCSQPNLNNYSSHLGLFYDSEDSVVDLDVIGDLQPLLHRCWNQRTVSMTLEFLAPTTWCQQTDKSDKDRFTMKFMTNLGNRLFREIGRQHVWYYFRSGCDISGLLNLASKSTWKNGEPFLPVTDIKKIYVYGWGNMFHNSHLKEDDVYTNWLSKIIHPGLTKLRIRNIPLEHWKMGEKLDLSNIETLNLLEMTNSAIQIVPPKELQEYYLTAEIDDDGVMQHPEIYQDLVSIPLHVNNIGVLIMEHIQIPSVTLDLRKHIMERIILSHCTMNELICGVSLAFQAQHCSFNYVQYPSLCGEMYLRGECNFLRNNFGGDTCVLNLPELRKLSMYEINQPDLKLDLSNLDLIRLKLDKCAWANVIKPRNLKKLVIVSRTHHQIEQAAMQLESFDLTQLLELDLCHVRLNRRLNIFGSSLVLVRLLDCVVRICGVPDDCEIVILSQFPVT